MKRGRVRCGSCQRLIYTPDARNQWDRDGQGAQAALKRRLKAKEAKAQPPTGEELEALIAFRSGPGERPPLARAAVNRWDSVKGLVKVIMCSGKNCAIRYAVESGELSERMSAADVRGEDLFLTTADRDRL